MTFFPQIGAGSVAQFPVRRRRRWRSIANELESAERVLLPDLTGGQIEWQLVLKDLSDQECATINALFNSAQGQFRAFRLVDPMANLLGWSEDFTRPDWQCGLLLLSAEASDPMGTTRASSISNSSAGVQGLQQSLGIPGEYVTCFSVWLAGASGMEITLSRDGRAESFAVGAAWTRVWLSCPGTRGADSSTYAISLPAGGSVRVFGPQVEVQPFASDYKPTRTARGIYQETYFGSDELRMVSTAPGLSSCEILLCSRV